jgi:hypothetical protein
MVRNLSAAVGRALFRLLASDSWRLTHTAEPAPADPPTGSSATIPTAALLDTGSVDAGSAVGVSWFAKTEGASQLQPEVFVVGGAVLARATFPAVRALGYDGSFDRFDRLMAGRSWVRLRLGRLLFHNASLLPAAQVGMWLPHPSADVPATRVPATDVGTRDGGHPTGYTVYDIPAAGRRAGARWTIGPDQVPTFVREHVAGSGTRDLSFPGPAMCPFPLPSDDDVVDAEELSRRLARTAPKPPRRPKGYQVDILEGDEEDGPYPWTLTDPNLHKALGVEHNHDAEDMVKEALRSSGIRLDAGVVFDSSGDTFYAYARSTTAAEQLAQIIADLVAHHRPTT